jgi:hypothetical protein
LGSQEGRPSFEVDTGDCWLGATPTGLGNLDVDVVGATNSLTRDVMLMLMLMLIVVVVIAIFVVVLLSAWIGGGVWKTGIIVP